MNRTVVYFDVETDSLALDCQIIQLAAIAVRPGWKEAATFERKLRFDESKAEKQALEKNHYDPAVWAAEAVTPKVAVKDFSSFLEEFRTLELISKRTGNPYTVARLAGYNSETFDKPRLWSLFKENNCFLPADPRTLDVLQRVLWKFEAEGVDLPNYQLSTVARHLGIPNASAHEALSDVRMAVAVAQKVC